MKSSVACFILTGLAACAARPPAESANDAASASPSAEAAPAASAPAPAGAPATPEPGSAAPAAHDASEHHADLAAAMYILPERSEHGSQSPINIETTRAVAGTHRVRFHYQTSREHVDNLGHTIKVTYDSGSSLEYDGKSYDLLQFHFHTPSEHLLDGITYPMEMHLVHAEHDHPEHLLVVGVLFKEGLANGLLDTLMATVPGHAGEHADLEAQVDARSVLGRGDGYYHYEGSLTTPPYSETVTWLVLDQAHTASAEQLEALNRIEGNNARHIQDRNARLIEHWQ